MKENETQAFAGGSPVWVIAGLEQSRWAQKLDWYLNFQLRRASLHESKKISESNQEKIASWGFEVSQSPRNQKAPLLVDSRHLLPNRFTIQIPFEDVASWAKTCSKVLREMKQTGARIFLPSDVSKAQFTKAVADQELQFEVIEESALG